MSRDESRRSRNSPPPQDEEPPVDRAPDSPDDDDGPPWDADDARRRDDQFAPPEVPCECWCMHCRRVFMSVGIWFQRVVGDPQGFAGFWKCPTPNCGGAGFTFDIFPTDPTHPANAGWCHDDGDHDDEEEEWGSDDTGDAEAEWDPDESKYKVLDEAFGDDADDDIEGEEWKYGLQPGEGRPGGDWDEQARLEAQAEEDEQERMYDQRDERPRVIDWSDREDRKAPPGGFLDDDIPF